MIGRFRTVLAALAMLMSASAADSAWIAVQNDTKRVIVVQSAIVVNGQVKRGRPVRLLPGEVFKEFHQPPTVALEVYDPQVPNKAVLCTPLAIKNENQKFSVSPNGNGVTVTELKK
ncbi:MAG: hypothetical protein U0791_22080 [Gemmataceae bacterium]